MKKNNSNNYRSILILAAISVPFAATEFSDMKDHWAKANVKI